MALTFPPEVDESLTVPAVDEACIAFGRKRWEDGDAAVARGDYFEGSPREIMNRLRAADLTIGART